MSKKDKAMMPQSTAGLVRYFESSKESLKLKPEYIVIFSIIIIVIEIMLKLF